MQLRKKIINLVNWKHGGLLAIPLFFILLAALPLTLNESIKNTSIDLQFKLRGSRQLSDKIVLVFIGDEDLKALNEKGDWPITRDYYGYIVYMLDQLGAKVIGIDVLFSTEDVVYPEYDVTMAELFHSVGNVCLPFIFSELEKNYQQDKELLSNFLIGCNPTFPIERFRTEAGGMGFSNFQHGGVIRKVPLVAVYADSFMLSFGTELAHLYLAGNDTVAIRSTGISFQDSLGGRYSFPVDQYATFRLNHFGDIQDLSSISFVDLLQNYDPVQDSLSFENKVVILAVTSPGVVKLRSTPLSSALPATLIHATVAENIIEGNYLREIPFFIHWLIIAMMAVFAWLIFRFDKVAYVVGAGIAVLLAYWTISMIGFSRFNLIIPLFYPSLAYLATVTYIEFRRNIDRHLQEYAIRILMNEQIRTKESQLEAAKSKVDKIQSQLSEEATISEQTRQIADERENTIHKLEKELRDLKTYSIPQKQLPKIESSEIIYSQQSKMAHVLELAVTVSSDDIPVLIMGETGTGKEMIARLIHNSSKRKNAPFIAINCGALSETLLESELFGHEKGSFTGAHSRRRGRFELANGGTIFLDEITETTQAFQTRLLRVLQESSFERIGSEQTIKVNVRVIAATNKNLQDEMENSRFRSDLFYRLNGFPITLPPLRERQQDIPLLAIHFLNKHGYRSVASFSDRAMEILMNHYWQGNVRELENIVRRAAIIAQSEKRNIIRENDLPDEILKSKSSSKTSIEYKPFEQQLLETLRSFQFSRSAISQTAKALGNRDRGTVTEYFRGICFEQLVNSNFSIDQAAKEIAGTEDEHIVERVQAKIDEYLNNLQIDSMSSELDYLNSDQLPSAFKGLPKKYHSYLLQIIENLQNRSL